MYQLWTALQHNGPNHLDLWSIQVADLWVIHVIGNDRPELESYKYESENDPRSTILRLSRPTSC